VAELKHSLRTFSRESKGQNKQEVNGRESRGSCAPIEIFNMGLTLAAGVVGMADVHFLPVGPVCTLY